MLIEKRLDASNLIPLHIEEHKIRSIRPRIHSHLIEHVSLNRMHRRDDEEREADCDRGGECVIAWPKEIRHALSRPIRETSGRVIS